MQMITLEEAADRLGISNEEMKKRLKTDPDFKKLSQIRDGSTVRFKVAAIDELARQLGMASEDALTLAPMDPEPPGSDDFRVPAIEDKKKAPKKGDDAPLDFGTGDDEVFSLTEEPAPKSSGKLAPGKLPKPPKGLSDSSAGSSDSDVRLDAPGKAKRAKPDEAAVPTEELALDFSGPGSAVIKGGSSAKLSAPKTGGSSGKLDAGKGQPAEGDSSEFELSLDADSDDFDLQMSPSAADEVDLGSLPKGGRASPSGINLGSPKDSGVSLEGKSGAKNKAEESDESDLDFELSLDASTASSSTKLGAPKSGKLVLDSDSDSEFELTLDDSGASLEQAALDADMAEEVEDKGDIFETDFEIPAMPDESGSEAVALESDTDLEKSDFELAMDEGEVVEDDSAVSEEALLDDEEAPPARGGVRALKGRKRPAEDDAEVDLSDDAVTDDEEASASKALKGARGKQRDTDEEDDEELVPAGAAAPTKPWGIVPVLFLAPAFMFAMVGALVGYELLQTMWGYQQPRKPAAPIVRGIASQMDMELRDQ